jgi:hypothetical protein
MVKNIVQLNKTAHILLSQFLVSSHFKTPLQLISCFTEKVNMMVHSVCNIVTDQRNS